MTKQEKIVTLQSVDNLLANAEYLLRLLGYEDTADSIKDIDRFVIEKRTLEIMTTKK